MYSRPSSSHRCAPSARVTKNGARSNRRKALTGEFTPPGITRHARSNSSSEIDMSPVYYSSPWQTSPFSRNGENMSAHDADTVRSVENGQPNRRQQKRREWTVSRSRRSPIDTQYPPVTTAGRRAAAVATRRVAAVAAAVMAGRRAVVPVLRHQFFCPGQCHKSCFGNNGKCFCPTSHTESRSNAKKQR